MLTASALHVLRHGGYLRPGAVARFDPVPVRFVRFAAQRFFVASMILLQPIRATPGSCARRLHREAPSDLRGRLPSLLKEALPESGHTAGEFPRVVRGD